MAAPGGKFFIQDNLKEAAVHHKSFKDLWETKWKQPVSSVMSAVLKNVELNGEIVHNGGLPIHVFNCARLPANRRQAHRGIAGTRS